MADPVGLFDALRKLDTFRKVTTGKPELGLADIKRDMDNAGRPATGGEISRMLKSFGYRREGWQGTGYDRTPRYVYCSSVHGAGA